MPPAVPPHRFTLLDGMILIAALAPGFAVVRAFVPRFGSATPFPGIGRLAWQGLAGSLPVATTAMAGLAAVRLRRPRPPLRRLARQPGAMACVAVLIAAAPVALAPPMAYLFNLARGRPTPPIPIDEVGPLLAISLTPACSFAVATAWTTLALNRRWRPEPGWIDRAGRALGVYWLGMVPACILVWILEIGLI